jgi:hypothetical protein
MSSRIDHDAHRERRRIGLDVPALAAMVTLRSGTKESHNLMRNPLGDPARLGEEIVRVPATGRYDPDSFGVTRSFRPKM